VDGQLYNYEKINQQHESTIRGTYTDGKTEMIAPTYIFGILQNPTDFFKFNQFGDNAVVLAILFILYTGLKIFGEWLKRKKDRNADFIQTISDAMTVIKDQIIVMNQNLNEIKTASIMTSGLTENISVSLGKIDDVCDETNSAVKVLIDRNGR